MGKKFLVTGGAGFIGSAIVKRLVQEGHWVRVLDNLSRTSATRLSDVKDQLEFVEGDIRDASVVSRAAKGVEAVCHLAFVNGTEFFYKKPDLVLDVGVRGMINVVDACLEHNIKEFVLASSSEVYQTPPTIPTNEKVALSIPDPLNPRYSYGAGKIISEIMALNYGRKHFDRVVIFRPHNVYGPNMGSEHVIPQFAMRLKALAQETKEGPIRFPIQGSGKETRAFIYIEDFTQGLLQVIEKGEHLNIYHIGTQEEVEIGKIAALVADYFGRSIELEPGSITPGSTQRRCPDVSKIKALGFGPKWPLKEGVEATCKWYDEHSKEE